MAKSAFSSSVLAAAFVLVVSGSAFAQVPGAIFTTVMDGTRVNANLYPTKCGPTGGACLEVLKVTAACASDRCCALRLCSTRRDSKRKANPSRSSRASGARLPGRLAPRAIRF